MKAVATIGADLAAGFGMLTRLPVGWLVRPGMPYRPGRAVWCYPLAGGLVGGIGCMVLLASRAMGMPSLLGAAWTVAVSVWLTGGLHEDGLADLADGCGGGRTPEARLSIMRDSRIGAFGALALVLALGIRLAALNRLGGLPVGQMAGWLVVSGALSRMAMLPVLMLTPARADGLGRSLGTVAPPVLLLTLAIGAAMAVMLLGGGQAAAAIAMSLLIGWIVALFVRSRLGGRTGDALGACVIAAECGLLSLATTLARGS